MPLPDILAPDGDEARPLHAPAAVASGPGVGGGGRALALALALALVQAGCAAPLEEGDGGTFGPAFEGGQFHLGPVDWQESEFHNACAPPGGYRSEVRAVEGVLLAGLWSGVPGVAGLCDACIEVTTGQGRSARLRVVTYGDTAPNSIDVSPQAFALLDRGEYPRAMRWQLARCPDTGPVLYEFQTGSSQWWTSLWVRNARVPVARVEVRSASHPGFVELARGSDGTLTDGAGFGAGSFTLRVTGVDGQVLTDTFAWPGGGVAGVLLRGGNFR